MHFFGGFARASIFGAVLIVLAGNPVRAQVPVLPPEPAEIAACLSLQQSVAALSADMSAKNQALDAVKNHLADLDSQLAHEKPQVNVNNPDAVARYKALLEQRDARYNARVNEYNARCANRPFNSAVVAQVQAQLVCPPPQ